MKKIVFLLTLVVIVFTNCKEEQGILSKRQREITRNELKEKAPVFRLKSEVIQLDKPLSNVRELLFHNGLLYISEISGTDSIVSVVDPRNGKGKGFLFKAGDGPNELSFVDNMNIQKDTLVFFDPYEYKVYLKPVEKRKPLNWPDDQTEVVQIKDVFADNIVYVNGRLFVIYYVAEKTARFAELDPDTGDLLGFFGELPYHPDISKIDERIHNMMNTVRTVTKPDGSKFALAYDYQDLIEIYNEDGTLLNAVRGPDLFFPAFNAKDRKGGGFRRAPIRGKTRKAYLAARTTEDELWLLYSGKVMYPLEKDKASESYLGPEIFVYDWNGNYQRSYQLDTPVYNFCLDAEQQVIYAISDVNDTQLLRFPMK